MKSHRNVGVKIDVAACIRAIAWAIALLASLHH